MASHTAFQYASAPLNNNSSAYIFRDDIDRYLAYDDIEDASDRSTSIPLRLPELQGFPSHQQFKPITPSRAMKRPMNDPFVGASEAKPSPILTPRRQVQKQWPQVAYDPNLNSPSPTPLKSVAPYISSRVNKSICRVLFPSSHRQPQPHRVPLADNELAKDSSTNTDSTGIAYFQCCAGCYGTYVNHDYFRIIDNADTGNCRRFS
jgi:hypothetical protein